MVPHAGCDPGGTAWPAAAFAVANDLRICEAKILLKGDVEMEAQPGAKAVLRSRLRPYLSPS